MKKSALAAVAVALMSVMAPLPAEAQFRRGFNDWDGYRNQGYVNRWDGNRRYYNRYRPFYGGYDDHVARCEARFRSYDASTDMYLGYDGNYHRCRL